MRAWIKVDTGMNRLGFRLEEFARGARAPARAIRASRRTRRWSRTWRAPTIVAIRRRAQQLDAFDAATAGLAGARSIANSRGRARLAGGARRLGASRA